MFQELAVQIREMYQAGVPVVLFADGALVNISRNIYASKEALMIFDIIRRGKVVALLGIIHVLRKVLCL